MNRIAGAALAAALALAATPAGARQKSEMTAGGPKPAPPPSGLPRFQDLSPAEQAELLRIEAARRTGSRRGAAIDCGAERVNQPMTQLERANWRLKCGR